jgi:heavy metal translocating P-type ATPase
MSNTEVEQLCLLCGNESGESGIREGNHLFCCAGCRAVYQILSAKNQLDHACDHPVFKQAIEAGLISNPQLLDQLRKRKLEVDPQERERIHLEVEGMWCPSCAEVIRLFLLQTNGVLNVVVDYTTDLAAIEYSPRHVTRDEISAVISNLGYQPRKLEDVSKGVVSRRLILQFGVASFCALNVMMLAYPIYASFFFQDPSQTSVMFTYLSFFFSLPTLFFSAEPIWKRFWNSLRVGLFGMETLVVLGVSAAFIQSSYELFWLGGTHVYFDAMNVIIAFVLLGKIVETRAKFSAKESLLALSRSLPRRCRKLFDGEGRFVPVKEVVPGDLITLFSGEKVALDGVIDQGSGLVDESHLTGESIPLAKKAGDQVISGSICKNGSFTYRVVRAEGESALSTIITMMEQDVQKKGHYFRIIDLVVRWFVPVILVLASAVVIGMEGTLEQRVLRFMSILLISCPCALGIAVPLAEAGVIRVLGEMGVIVRNRGVLRKLGRENVFLFDKTGTVTEGRFRVVSGLEGMTGEERAILRSLEEQSIHPIAGAIVESIESLGEKSVKIERVQEVAGRGMTGVYRGERILCGSARLLKEEGIAVDEVDISDPHVYFAKGKSVIGLIVLGDQMRSEISAVIKDLSPAESILLSGDHNKAVEKIGRQGGFSKWYGERGPLDKRGVVEELKGQGRVVAMVGDGINDAPALAAADVSLSVVAATDLSIQVSDLLLTTDRLDLIPRIRGVAVMGRRIIWQNLFWAFFYNVVNIPLACMGLLNPLYSVGAMIASSLMVILNSLRIDTRCDP